jgi:hypothetical protein
MLLRSHSEADMSLVHPVHGAEVLIAGSRHGNGVAGMMHSSVVREGIKAEFVELAPPPAQTIRARLARRLDRTLRSLRKPDKIILSRMKDGAARYVIIADGKSVSPQEVEECRLLASSRGGGIAQYLCDDPFAPAYRSTNWHQGLQHYDIVYSTKRNIMADLKSAGASDVRFVWFAFDPCLHMRRTEVRALPQRFVADVAFAGSSDKDRIPIFLTIRRCNPELEMRLYSGRWASIAGLRSCARAAVYGIDYCHAMLAAKMCPCLVRHSNRDGHVMRTFELLAMSCFMLAERTPEHQELMKEGRHCEMWDTGEELADKCNWYASRPRDRVRMADRGCELIRSGQHTYLDRVIEILRALGFRR